MKYLENSLKHIISVHQQRARMLNYDEVSVGKLIMIIICVSTGLVVSVKVVHGELEQATKENPLLLKNVCITKKLGFSDVIMPGDVR